MAAESDVVKGLVAAALQDWRRKLAITDKGRISECWQNVFEFLENHEAWAGVIAFDMFAQRVVKLKPPPFDMGAVAGPWTSDDDLELGLWLKNQKGSDQFVLKSRQALIDGVSAVAQRHRFHPVRDFMQKCTPGDKRRLDTWLTDFLGVRPTDYTRAVGRYFLINMVARVFHPGCIMRSVLVLEGAQDRGKSTALYELAQPWFSDTHFDLQSKDAFEVIQGNLLYEISEMEQFSKAEATRVKQFISSREDNYRPPYERRAQRIPRQVVFAGSTNDRRYLRDWTGNTRFWPVRCEEVGQIDAIALGEARAGLFAEALEAYRNKARRHPTREEQRSIFEPEQARRRQEHPWLERVEHWLEDLQVDGSRRTRTSVVQVLSECLKVEFSRMTTAMARDVGVILTTLGWEQHRESAGKRERYYERPVQPADAASREPGSDDDPIPF